jgi:hypothetical protein
MTTQNTTKFTYIAQLFQFSLVLLLVVNLRNQLCNACFASGICGGGSKYFKELVKQKFKKIILYFLF